MQPVQTKCVECGKPSLTGIYCSRSCRREANRQPAPLPRPTPPRKTVDASER